VKLPYGYSLVELEQDANYTPDVGVFMTDPYPTVADALGVDPASRLTVVSLPAAKYLGTLPVIKKSQAAPAPSMIYYQVTTSPGKLISPLPITNIGDPDTTFDFAQSDYTWLFIAAGIVIVLAVIR